ncbi:alpha/beta hydrolase [Actinomycetes bacterium NPDC127524]
MPVNAKIKYFLDKMKEIPQMPLDKVSPEDYRKRENRGLDFQQPKEQVHDVEDKLLSLDGRDLPIRIYTPEGLAPYPALVFFHGGGWVIGSLESHDSICRTLANTSGCKVISVGYRLAPENKFPAAVNDAYDSLVRIASEHKEYEIDPARIAVGGDSAGGNLAAVACIMSKERRGPSIIHQLLIYPSTGYEEEPPSMQENGEGYLLTGEIMQWFRSHYFNRDEEINDPYASPFLYQDLSGLPPASIFTAEYDPLRDVGKAYAEKLRASGVPVFYKNYSGLIHGYANFAPVVPEAKMALEEAALELHHAVTNIK